MKTLAVLMAALTIMLAACVAGCSGQFPLRWRATEHQRQAIDLTVQGAQALRGQVLPAAEPIRAEVERTAQTAQLYFGLPKTRLKPAEATNAPIVEQAAADAARPPPTPGQVAGEVVKELERGTQTGMGLAELLLTAAGTIAGTWGATRLGQRVVGWRQQARDIGGRLDESFVALTEVAQGIDSLPPETKTIVKASQRQSPATELLVAGARKGTLKAPAGP